MAKRRKVWVNFYSSGTGFTLPSRAKARETAAPGAVEIAVPFAERLPGDVVLGKWQLDEDERLRGIGRGEDALDLILSLRGRR